MAKKNFFTILYAAILSFFCVFIFSKINQRDLILQLDNHNLTSQTYQIDLPKNEKLSDFTDELNKSSKINNVQVHFQSKKDKNVTYFYGKGNFAVPPMISGSFFSKNDFDSIVNVTVVGQNLKKKLYKPKDQAYLHFDNCYIPVLGIMGDKTHSKLDDQIFIAGGKDILENLTSNDFVIKIDGRKDFSEKTLKNTFNAVNVKKVEQQNTFIQSGSWISNHLMQVLELLLVVLAMLLGIFVWGNASEKDFRAEVFASRNKKLVIFNEWRSFTTYNGIGMVVGTLIGTVVYTLSTYVQLIPFIIGLFVLSSAVFYVTVRKKINQIEIKI